MGHQELLKTITELKELKVMADELADQITALEDTIKAEMAARDVDKLTIGAFKITWTRYTSSRFDSKAFKATHAELYDQYCKPVEARRFAVA